MVSLVTERDPVIDWDAMKSLGDREMAVLGKRDRFQTHRSIEERLLMFETADNASLYYPLLSITPFFF